MARAIYNKSLFTMLIAQSFRTFTRECLVTLSRLGFNSEMGYLVVK